MDPAHGTGTGHARNQTSLIVDLTTSASGVIADVAAKSERQ
jgi:hypothetical protein